MENPTGLSPEQRRALATLTRAGTLSAFYLAGGTAIALHLAHRRSVDLDFFSRDPNVDLAQVRAQLIGLLASAEVVAETDAALSVRQGALAVDVVRYPYPLLDETTLGPENVPLASLRDLAAMKLSAIAKRGIKRDFWDLHEITTASPIDLERALESYVEKFGVREADLYHVLRSLTYFDDADRESVFPAGLTPEHWQRIQSYFRSAAPLRLG